MAVQLTAGLDVPVTVAVNCLVAPGCTVALVGEIATATLCTVPIVMAADALLVVSATLVAVTANAPAALPAV